MRGIDLASVASTPGFIWLWVGSGLKGDGGVGLELGRELLAGWGYRSVSFFFVYFFLLRFAVSVTFMIS